MSKKISEDKKALLQAAQDYCDNNNKSTEFMIQYMQNHANVSYDVVIQFLRDEAGK